MKLTKHSHADEVEILDSNGRRVDFEDYQKVSQKENDLRKIPGIHKYSEEKDSLKEQIYLYQPVLVLFFTAILTGGTLSMVGQGSFISLTLGFSLVLFAMLKLFDLEGFKESFSEYDLISSQWKSFGYAYPFIELLLGLGILAQMWMPVVLFATIIVMSVTAAGVFLALVQKRELKCACTGSLVDVPLGSFSLIESIGMIAMAMMVLAI